MATTEIIKSASIARVTRKSDGKFLGWGVKSNSSNEYYEVHCTKIADECVWSCSCKAGQMNFSGCKDGKCCHVKAVIEVSQARKEMKEAPIAEPEVTPAEPQQTGKFHAGMFIGSRGCSVYVSNEEMDALKARVATRKAAKQEDETSFPKAKSATVKRAKQFENMPLNGNQGFSLLKPAC